MFLFALGCASPTGAGLTVDYFALTDVVGFHFEVDRVACTAGHAFVPYHMEGDVDLVDGIFPAQIEVVEAEAFAEDTRHTAADLFLALEPGCYDILAAPASDMDALVGQWTPSTQCSVAAAFEVDIVPGQTTEVILRSQCEGDPSGASDLVVVLNHPPLITTPVPAEHVFECQAVDVCVELYDPNDDALETTWTSVPEGGLHAVDLGDLEVVDFDDGHRVWRQCAEIVANTAATYEWTVEVHDIGWEGTTPIRLEEVTGGASSDALHFPIYTNWVADPMCFDAYGDLVPDEGLSVPRVVGCEVTSPEDWYCSGAYDVDAAESALYCDGTSLDEDALYASCEAVPADDGGPPDGPM